MLNIDETEFLNRVYDKIESVAKDQSDIKITLAKQEEQLRLHVYRTDLAEQNIEKLRAEIKPAMVRITYVEGFLKVIGALAIVATAVSGIATVAIRFFGK